MSEFLKVAHAQNANKPRAVITVTQENTIGDVRHCSWVMVLTHDILLGFQSLLEVWHSSLVRRRCGKQARWRHLSR